MVKLTEEETQEKNGIFERIVDNKPKFYTNDQYFIIDDYDIRFFTVKYRRIILEINTYPNDPRELLKLIDFSCFTIDAGIPLRPKNIS